MADIYGILDALSELVYISDIETHKILYMNNAGQKVLGDCVGKTRSEVFSQAKDVCLLNNLGDECYSYKLTNKATGKTYMVRDKIIVWNERKALLEIVFDITKEEKTKHDLEARLENEHFLVSCIIEMHRNNSLDKALNSLLEMIGKFLEADRVYVFEYNGITMNNIYEWCADGVTPEIDNMQNMDARIIDRWIEPFSEGLSVIIGDIEEVRTTSPLEYCEMQRRKANRVVASPLDNNGALIGYIGIDNPPKEKISESELFFATLGYFISSSLIRIDDEKRLIEMSYIDTLTNLNNRNRFIKDTEEMNRSKAENFGVLYMDMNGLKETNDKKGHNAGDEALREIAEAVTDVFGQEHAYRVGGDEFVVLCQGVKEEDFLSGIERLNERLSRLEHTSAIGYQYSDKACDIDEIVRMADEKMYLDKKYFYRNQKKSSRYRFRNDTFAAISTPELLKKLINEERFVIWFQPRFSADTKEFCGSEALIRFFDEDDVIVSPMDFIPEMEDNETIHLIDLYVFRHVCEYISGWINEGKTVKPVSVNMSHKTLLKPNFIENIMNIWYDYNIPKELVIIEVAEEEEKGRVVDVLMDLKKCGFKIAIDNFGSKYADLYLFANLKFDILKLDGDMVYKIANDKKARMLSTSIAQICHSENIKIVAEGVENEKELEILRDMGCDEVQGYLFDKPMSWNRFEEKYL
ncbi:MAG: EAL domain-containing protein [Hominilimicola sp.]